MEIHNVTGGTFDTAGKSSPSPSSVLHSINLVHIFSAVLVYIIAFAIFDALRTPQYPSSIPWLGVEGKGALAKFLVRFKSISNARHWAHEGYERYNKQGRAFILPNLPGLPLEIVVPRSQMAWMLDQPDSVLSTSEAHYETLHGEYAFIMPHLLKDAYHEHVIHKSLARNLHGLIPSLEDEVVAAMDDLLGLDETQWKSVNIWNMLIGVVSRATNRMMIGLPAGRNQHYLDNMIGFTNSVVGNMMLLSATPGALKPVVGRVSNLWGWYHWKQTSKHSIPVIQDRLRAFERKEAGDPEFEHWTPPNDYVSWHIKVARAEGRADELDPVRVSQRLTPINFASIHTTVLTGHATLLDLLSSDPSRDYISQVQEECSRVWSEEGNKATRDGLARMFRTDSAIRESMRFSGFGTTLVARKVMAKEGITNPVEGWHAPYGSFLSLNVRSASYDADNFDDPTVYDAFRYSREREVYEASGKTDSVATGETLKLKQQGMVTTGATHLGFGHGRHACPGRFFVAHELKILLGHLFRNYDVKPMAKRPETKWFATNIIPATDTVIEVRRRPVTVKK